MIFILLFVCLFVFLSFPGFAKEASRKCKIFGVQCFGPRCFILFPFLDATLWKEILRVGVEKDWHHGNRRG